MKVLKKIFYEYTGIIVICNFTFWLAIEILSVFLWMFGVIGTKGITIMMGISVMPFILLIIAFMLFAFV